MEAHLKRRLDSITESYIRLGSLKKNVTLTSSEKILTLIFKIYDNSFKEEINKSLIEDCVNEIHFTLPSDKEKILLILIHNLEILICPNLRDDFNQELNILVISLLKKFEASSKLKEQNLNTLFNLGS